MARTFGIYLPRRGVADNFTLPQRVSLGVDSLKEYMALLVCLSAILLPIALWPMESNDLSQSISEQNRRLLGWAYLVSHIGSRMNNYIVYGMNADAYVLNGKREKYWTVPCKPKSTSHRIQRKCLLMRCMLSRYVTGHPPRLPTGLQHPLRIHRHQQLEFERTLSYPSSTIYGKVSQLRHDSTSRIRVDWHHHFVLTTKQDESVGTQDP